MHKTSPTPANHVSAPQNQDGCGDVDTILKSYHRACERRAGWETHWQECYDFALPHHDTGMDGTGTSISNKPAGAKVRNTL